MEFERGDLYLGGILDPQSGNRTGDPLLLRARDLTTHGVITAMTGSGKTGLGIILLEEALLNGIPALILDPKGDIGNLLFTFPDLRPEDFEPWLDPAEAAREGVDRAEFARRTATRWREGLAGWGIGPERLAALRDAAEFTLFTPGSSAGAGLNLVGSLAAPSLDWAAHEEVIRDEIEGYVSSLLAMAGRQPDPISDPEHILLSNLIEHEWRHGRSLDLPRLIGLVPTPPLRKLGVFPLDDFLPPARRMELAMRLNGLVASNAFSGWLRGAPLDMDRLLRTPDGRPTASILHLAHLSDAERQFVVTLVLTRLITWMRRQPGTSDLRLLVYIDEMFGFAPPTAQPPSKKPLLTLFKQARAHGVGLVVATQNPVDIDYKMMSNAGTWLVGRLQTERDKLRVLEGLASATGGVDTAAYGERIGALRKREFVLVSAGSVTPTLFTTRWAMSFLRGPLTRQEVQRLQPAEAGTVLEADASVQAVPEGVASGGSGDSEAATAAPTGTSPPTSGMSAPGAPPSPLRPDESPVEPNLPGSVRSVHLDPGAPWADRVGCLPGSPRLEPAVVARVALTFDDHHADVDHREEWEAVFFPLEGRFDPAAGIAVDYDDRDLRSQAPTGARYVLPAAPITDAAFYRSIATELRDHLHREQTVEILRNPELRLYARVGEGEDAFRERCREAAESLADAEVARLRDRYATRIDRVREALAQAERRVRELEVDVSSRRQQEVLAGAGKLLSVFLGGKANAGSLGGFASRRSMTVRTGERLRSAEERAGAKEAEIEQLEGELADAIDEILARARERADRIEPMAIGLEKNDISVRDVALLWIPRPPPTGAP